MSTVVVNGASHVVIVAHADAVAKLIDCVNASGYKHLL